MSEVQKLTIPKTIILTLLVLLASVLNILKQIVQPFYRLVFCTRVPAVVRTPEDRFNNLHAVGYTFTSNYIELDGGCGVKLPRVHYLDEGPRDGQVILCLHGEPTWSFLYRNMIPTLVSAGFRVIVPDFIGFGKSDKYSHPVNYTHEMHTLTLRLLLDRLNVQEITLVCQDWGGLTGLSVVKDCPQLFSNLVIMNTALPAPGIDPSRWESTFSGFQAMLPFVLWRTLVLLVGTWLPLDRLFTWSFKRHNLPRSVIEGYLAPHPTPLYKGGVAAWPLLVPLLKDDPVCAHMVEANNCLKTWKKPVLLMFGDCDIITRGREKGFLKMIPQAQNIPIRGASHFLQETHGVELSTNIVKFLKNSKLTQL